MVGHDDRWEIDQDEFGAPMVRHRHPIGTIAAYVTKDPEGTWKARCPSCSETFQLPTPPGRGLGPSTDAG
jgi:hypothetical protein